VTHPQEGFCQLGSLDCQNGRKPAATAKMAAIANLVPNTKNIFGTIFATSKRYAKRPQKNEKFCQKILTQKSGFFSCNLKMVGYNVDIRSKRERKRERK